MRSNTVAPRYLVKILSPKVSSPVIYTTAEPVRRRGLWGFAVPLGLSLLLMGGGVGTTVMCTRPYMDPADTMEGTISRGDRVLVDRTSDIRRGDVIVITLSEASQPSPALLIKRVIGVGGDRVASNGAKVTVNGKALDETYLYPGDAPSQVPFDATVPPGRLWLMGDHRSISADSRSWTAGNGDGPTPEARAVVGRVVVKSSGSGIRMLGTPRTFLATGLAAPRSRPPTAVMALYATTAGILLFLMTGAAAFILYMLTRRRRGAVR
jgi:signal peptidase I